MQHLLFIVLNKTEYLEDILTELGNHNIIGATILDSEGMVRSLYAHDELRFMGSLRRLIDPEHEKSKTIFIVLKEEKIPVVSDIVNSITGGLENPDTGVMFAVPISYAEGFGKKK